MIEEKEKTDVLQIMKELKNENQDQIDHVFDEVEAKTIPRINFWLYMPILIVATIILGLAFWVWIFLGKNSFLWNKIDNSFFNSMINQNNESFKHANFHLNYLIFDFGRGIGKYKTHGVADAVYFEFIALWVLFSWVGLFALKYHKNKVNVYVMNANIVLLYVVLCWTIYATARFFNFNSYIKLVEQNLYRENIKKEFLINTIGAELLREQINETANFVKLKISHGLKPLGILILVLSSATIIYSIYPVTLGVIAGKKIDREEKVNEQEGKDKVASV